MTYTCVYICIHAPKHMYICVYNHLLCVSASHPASLWGTQWEASQTKSLPSWSLWSGETDNIQMNAQITINIKLLNQCYEKYRML